MTQIIGLIIVAASAVVSNLKELKWDFNSDRPLHDWAIKNKWHLTLIAFAFLGLCVGIYGAIEGSIESKAQKQKMEGMRSLLLVGKKSIPEIYLFVRKKNTQHLLPDKFAEQRVAEQKFGEEAVKSQSEFLPQSVRDVLLPGTKNIADYDFAIFEGNKFGSFGFRLDRYGDQIFIKKSGYISIFPGSATEYIENIHLRLNSDTKEIEDALKDDKNWFWSNQVNKGTTDSFALILTFNDEWSWGRIYESLSKRYSREEPIMVFNKWHEKDNNVIPSFSELRIIFILSKNPTFRISMPLEVKNFTYDAENESYRYELHGIEAPEVITEYAY